ncbi:hypothetical protein [Formosa sp. 4Alg 33]|uniref:hypothetical protein n=1 Tax=Formosa sp. 4Alg 33 TaxID=3382189 RepID=UPI003D9C49E0
MKDSCCDINNNKLVVFEETRSRLVIENIDKVEAIKVTVDGCEITKGIRCDFMYIIKDTEIYIELKGQDIKHAIEQLEATIKKLSSNPKTKKKKSFVICTRSPLSSASIQNVRVKFRKNYNSDFIVKSSPHKHKE